MSTSRPLHSSLVAPVLLATCILAASCGTESNGAPDPSQGSAGDRVSNVEAAAVDSGLVETVTTETMVEQTAASDEDSDNATQSPLDSYFGFVPAGPAQFAEYEAYEVAKRDAVAGCLLDAGHSELATAVLQQPVVGAEQLAAADLQARESSSAVRVRGYLAYLLDERLEQLATGTIPGPLSGLEDTLNSLPSGQSDQTFADYVSCSNDVLDRLVPGDQEPNPELDAISIAINDELTRLRRRIALDPGFDLIWQDWSACMASQGYPAVDRSDATSQLEPQFESVKAQLDESAAQSGQPSAEVIQLVDDFKAVEQRVVTADLACVDEVELEDRFDALRATLERDEIERNGPSLELLRLELCQRLPPDDPTCGG